MVIDIPYKCLEDESSFEEEDLDSNDEDNDDAPIITDYEIETDINDEL